MPPGHEHAYNEKFLRHEEAEYALLFCPIQRQIYLSTYLTVFELRNDRVKLRQVLAINDSVLRGTRSPVDVPTRSHYDKEFAVVSKLRTVPPAWNRIYGNSDYAIFQIVP